MLRAQRFAEAADRFRSAFIPQISALESYGPSTISEAGKTYRITSDAFEEHRNAKISFRRHIDKEKRRAFEAAWAKYTGESVEPDKPFAIYRNQERFASPAYDDTVCKREREIIEQALNNIKALLEFARP